MFYLKSALHSLKNKIREWGVWREIGIVSRDGLSEKDYNAGLWLRSVLGRRSAGMCFTVGGTATKQRDGVVLRKGLEDVQKDPRLITVKKKIVKLRKRYEWGPNKIAGCLRHKSFKVDHSIVYRVICEEGLNNPIDKPRKTCGKKRFERIHSNSLWQADFKLCEDDFWMISFQDDHSRFITGSKKVWNPTGENAILLFEKAVGRFGVPAQLLTDQGTQFKPARGGVSKFTEFCKSLGIKHIKASKHRPTTI